MPIGFVEARVCNCSHTNRIQEKQKKELLEVAAEANAYLEEKCIEPSQDVQNPYDPNSGPSKPIPTCILFPKTPKIRKHAHSPLHQTPKSSASQIRKNLIRSPSRRRSKALVFEEMQTPNKATPTRSMNWKITPIKFTAENKMDDMESELRTTKVTVRDLNQRYVSSKSLVQKAEWRYNRLAASNLKVSLSRDRATNFFRQFQFQIAVDFSHRPRLKARYQVGTGHRTPIHLLCVKL